MLLTRVKGELMVECDDCGTESAGGVADFPEFIRDLKENGWKIYKEDDTWCHRCPECQEEIQ